VPVGAHLSYYTKHYSFVVNGYAAASPRPDVAKLLEVARRDPAGLLALDAIATIARRAPASPEAGEAVPLLIEQHAQAKGVGEIGLWLSDAQSGGAERLFRAILEKNAHAEDQALAGFGLTAILMKRSERLGRGESGDTAAAEAERLLERVISANLDLQVPFPFFGPLTKAAKIKLSDLYSARLGLAQLVGGLTRI
jgi:hypothetical protein